MNLRYPSDLTDAEWVLVEPLLLRPGKPGRKHGDLRRVVDALLYQVHTSCQWQHLPGEFGPWTRVWSQFSALVGQRHLGAGAGRTARARPDGAGPGGTDTVADHD
ncbi:transposase [Actinoplanes sp. NPDC049668]|uniref:transposase n=1 Tax=unclassified Actinoplanes TaxID=2626549 RepID=UPI0033BB0778